MTKQELNRYFWLQHEVRRQYKRLEALEEKSKHRGEIVGDTVKDYRTGHPRTIMISGYANEDITSPVMIKILQEEIEKNIKESEEVIANIERFVQSVENPQLRELLRARYIDCKKWDEIGEENFIASDYARYLIREFLKSLDK